MDNTTWRYARRPVAGFKPLYGAVSCAFGWSLGRRWQSKASAGYRIGLIRGEPRNTLHEAVALSTFIKPETGTMFVLKTLLCQDYTVRHRRLLYHRNEL